LPPDNAAYNQNHPNLLYQLRPRVGIRAANRSGTADAAAEYSVSILRAQLFTQANIHKVQQSLSQHQQRALHGDWVTALLPSGEGIGDVLRQAIAHGLFAGKAFYLPGGIGAQLAKQMLQHTAEGLAPVSTVGCKYAHRFLLLAVLQHLLDGVGF